MSITNRNKFIVYNTVKKAIEDYFKDINVPIDNVQVNMAGRSGNTDYYRLRALFSQNLNFVRLGDLIIDKKYILKLFFTLFGGRQINRDQIGTRTITNFFTRKSNDTNADNNMRRKENNETNVYVENEQIRDRVFIVPGRYVQGIVGNDNFEDALRNFTRTLMLDILLAYRDVAEPNVQLGEDITDNDIKEAIEAATEIINRQEEQKNNSYRRKVKSARTVLINTENNPPTIEGEIEIEQDVIPLPTLTADELVDQTIGQSLNDQVINNIAENLIKEEQPQTIQQQAEIKLEDPEILNVAVTAKGDFDILPDFIAASKRDKDDLNNLIAAYNSIGNEGEKARIFNQIKDKIKNIIVQNLPNILNDEGKNFIINIAQQLLNLNRGQENIANPNLINDIINDILPDDAVVGNVANALAGEIRNYIHYAFLSAAIATGAISSNIAFSVCKYYFINIFKYMFDITGVTRSDEDFSSMPINTTKVEDRLQEEIINNVYDVDQSNVDIAKLDAIIDEAIIESYNIASDLPIELPEEEQVDQQVEQITEVAQYHETIFIDSKIPSATFLQTIIYVLDSINKNHIASFMYYITPKPVLDFTFYELLTGIRSPENINNNLVSESDGIAVLDVFDREYYQNIYSNVQKMTGIEDVQYYEPVYMYNFYTQEDIQDISESISGQNDPKVIIDKVMKIMNRQQNIDMLKAFVFQEEYKPTPPDDPNDPDDNDGDGDFGDKIEDDKNKKKYFVSTKSGLVYILSSLTYYLSFPFKYAGIITAQFITYNIVLFSSISLAIVYIMNEYLGLPIFDILIFAIENAIKMIPLIVEGGKLIVDGIYSLFKFLNSKGLAPIIGIGVVLLFAYFYFSGSKVDTIKFSLF